MENFGGLLTHMLHKWNMHALAVAFALGMGCGVQALCAERSRRHSGYRYGLDRCRYT